MHSGYPILHEKCLPLKNERKCETMRNHYALKDITVGGGALKLNKKQPERGKLAFSFMSLIF